MYRGLEPVTELKTQMKNYQLRASLTTPGHFRIFFECSIKKMLKKAFMPAFPLRKHYQNLFRLSLNEAVDS